MVIFHLKLQLPLSVLLQEIRLLAAGSKVRNIIIIISTRIMQVVEVEVHRLPCQILQRIEVPKEQLIIFHFNKFVDKNSNEINNSSSSNSNSNNSKTPLVAAAPIQITVIIFTEIIVDRNNNNLLLYVGIHTLLET